MNRDTLQQGVGLAARISGLLLVALVAVFLVGEGGPPNVLRQPGPVQLEFLAICLMLTGFLLGWRWEALGGGLAVGGFALFFGTELAVNGNPPSGAIPLFAVPGILFLVPTPARCRVTARDKMLATGGCLGTLYSIIRLACGRILCAQGEN